MQQSGMEDFGAVLMGGAEVVSVVGGTTARVLMFLKAMVLHIKYRSFVFHQSRTRCRTHLNALGPACHSLPTSILIFTDL